MAKYLTTSEAAEKMEVNRHRPQAHRRRGTGREAPDQGRPLARLRGEHREVPGGDQSGERESPDYAKGFDAGYDEGFSDAEAERSRTTRTRNPTTRTTNWGGRRRVQRRPLTPGGALRP